MNAWSFLKDTRFVEQAIIELVRALHRMRCLCYSRTAGGQPNSHDTDAAGRVHPDMGTEWQSRWIVAPWRQTARFQRGISIPQPPWDQGNILPGWPPARHLLFYKRLNVLTWEEKWKQTDESLSLIFCSAPYQWSGSPWIIEMPL